MGTARSTTTKPTRRKPPAAVKMAVKAKTHRAQANIGPQIARRVSVEPGVLRQFIAEAAYFRAERRHFAAGGELQDWLEAEADIERLFSA